MSPVGNPYLQSVLRNCSYASKIPLSFKTSSLYYNYSSSFFFNSLVWLETLSVDFDNLFDSFFLFSWILVLSLGFYGMTIGSFKF